MAEENPSTEATATETEEATATATETVETPTLESLQAESADKDKIIESLRKENAKSRVNAKETAAKEARTGVLDEIAKALGLKEDEKPTVESLQAVVTEKDTALTEAIARAEKAERENAIRANAKAAGADPDLLLDSQKFAASLADADLTDTKTLIETMKAWVEDHPKYAASQVVGASTIEHAGGTGENSSITFDQFKGMDLRDQAAFARKNPAQFQAFADQL